MRLSEPTTKIWMKIDPYCQRQKCRPMTLVSGDMQIFAEVPWGGGVKRQCGCRQLLAIFNFFCGTYLRKLWRWCPCYYMAICNPTSAFHWSQNMWPWVTVSGYIALNSVFASVWLSQTARLSKNNFVKTNKDRHTLSAPKSLAGSLVSGNVRFVWIFARIL